jgi:hypothetical protein
MNVAQLIEKLQGMPQEAEVAVNTSGGLASIVGVIPFTHKSEFGEYQMVVLDNGSVPFNGANRQCHLLMSDREIMHKMVDKICDAQSDPDTDGNVDKTRATYRGVTSDGNIRVIFVHAYSIKYNAKK